MNVEDHNGQRDQWTSRRGFIYATIGAAVGLGNLWRFPFMAYENGGGAFLLPYLFALLTAGVPLMVMEFGLGHKMRLAAPGAMREIGKRWEWLGWWMVFIPLAVMVFYTVIVSWSLLYFVYSFTKMWGENPGAFFDEQFLAVSSGPWEFGGIQWPIFAATALVWLFTFWACRRGISKGIEWVCKVTTPLLGLLFLFILLRSVTLPGAAIGLDAFLRPDFAQIMNAEVWIAAYAQVFFSATLGVGVMIAYASYLPRKSDIVNNSYITVLANGSFDFVAGLAVFGILGYIVQVSGTPLQEIAASGAGIAFVVFPQAINLLPGGPVLQAIFGAMFFFSLMMAGISSVLSMAESFSSAVLDKFRVSRQKLVAIVSVVGFCVSVLFTTRAGVHLLSIVDHFVTSFGIAFVGLMEAIVLGYVYKAHIMRSYVNAVSDLSVGKWWDVCIKYVTPAVLGFTMVSSVLDEIARPYEGYPRAALVTFGWAAVAAMIVAAVIVSRTSRKQLGDDIRST
ncbi:sodium-dependent transporter [Numidum massiliense]|uniref:sodium-dependent transporter n=1 Tax=Numidum massiliense TaxID=1522315 RepID=UPI0006D574FA|nr:sodium-dependent transporter [Numidum massiliense]